MNNKDTLRNLLIAFAIFFTVIMIGPRFAEWLQHMFPPQAAPADAGVGAVSDTGASDTDWAPAVPPGSTAIQTGGAPPATAPDESGAAGLSVVEADMEQTRTIGTVSRDGTDGNGDSSPYRMQLVLSNVGASIESAALSDHAQAVGDPERYELLRLLERDDGTRYRSLAIETINVDDTVLTLYDKRWNVGPVTQAEPRWGDTGEKVEFWIEIHQDNQPVLKLTRTLTLPQQPEESGRHDLESNLTIQNLSNQPHRVLVTYRGGLGIGRSDVRMDDRNVDWGVREGGFVVGNRKQQAKATADATKPDVLYSASVSEPGVRLSWAATANTHFTCTIAPLNRSRNGEADYITAMAAFDVDGLSFTDDDVTLRFVTRQESLQPGAELSYPADVYLGAKNAGSFKTEPDYKARNYYYQISQGFGMCTFTVLVELMVWLLNSLFFVVHDFGAAIVILVLAVRALMHPITKKGQVNMVRMQHRMQEMAPKIEEIKKKYSNDKARMNQEMMKLNINPAGQLLTCLPMMIQLPIWIALYLSLSNNILMRHETCVFLPWVHDLTSPDALFTFSTPIVVPILGWTIEAFNLLPILVGVFMYTQQKLQPKPTPNPNQTDQQRQQQEMMQKMMPLMSIMMLLIFYKMPSGLNLYIMCSSLFGTIEQKRIRAHIKEHEAAGTLHKPPEKKLPPDGPAGKRRKPSFFQKLQAMAEDAQKAQAQRPRTGKRRR